MLKIAFYLFLFVSVIAMSDAQAQWATSIGGSDNDQLNSICATTDGGYAVAGSTNSFGAGNYDFWVLKVDASGNINWQKAYGGSNSDTATQIQPTSDGGFIVIGFSNSFSASDDAWVLKLDDSGNIQWQRSYGTTGNAEPFAVIQTSDGGYLFTGTINLSVTNGDAWLVKLTSGGNIQWQKMFGGAGNDSGQSVLELSTGQYVLAGYTGSYGSGDVDGFILFLDSSGNEQSAKTYGWSGGDLFYSIKETPDGALLAAGSSYSFNTGLGDYWLVKMTTSGNIIWQALYSGSDGDLASGIQIQSDNHYIITGYTESFGSGNWDFWLMKIASDGSIVWQKAYGGVSQDLGVSSAAAPNGGVMVAGLTASFSTGTNDGWLLKLTADGEIDDSCMLKTDTLISPTYVDKAPLNASIFEAATSVSIQVTTVMPTISLATTAQQCAVSCLFCDDFEDGILDSSWTYAKPSWSESGGDLIATAAKKALAVASPAFGGCADCGFEALITSDGAPGNKISLLGWYTDKGNNVEVLMKQPSGKFVMKQRIGGTIVAKTKALMALSPNVAYDVRVLYDGTALNLLVNGNVIATVAAPAPPAGTIALQAAKTTARFGSINVQ